MTTDHHPDRSPSAGDDLAPLVRRGLGALGDAALPVPDLDLASPAPTPLRPPDRRPRLRRGLLVGSGVVAAAAAVILAVFLMGDSPTDDGFDLAADSTDETDETDDPTPAQWQPVAAAPLPERNQAVLVWTGQEVIVAGGDTFTCPGDCGEPSTPYLADGAAYDPTTDTWRPLAEAPIGFAATEAVVVSDDVYVRARAQGREGVPILLRYSVTNDTWDQFPIPAGAGPHPLLVALPDTVVAYPDSVFRAEGTGWRFDPATGEWTPLPLSPLGPAADQTLIWAHDRLWLFAFPIDPGPGQSPLTQVASYDPDQEQWQPGAASDTVTTGPWLADGTLLINPHLGCIQGLDDTDGRCVPRGGVYDTATDTWSPLPAEPEAGQADVISSGVVGAGDGVLLGVRGYLLDAPTGQWLTLPPVPAADLEPQVVAAGTLPFAFGSADDATVSAQGWIWRPSGAPAPAPTAPPTPQPTASSSPTSPTSTTTPTSTTASTTSGESAGASWKDNPWVVNSPVCVPGDLPAGLDVTTPVYPWRLGDAASQRLDLITASAVYTAVDCAWVPILDLEREPGVTEWRCQQYEDGSEIQLWNLTNLTFRSFPDGGGEVTALADDVPPGLLFGIASCDPDNPANAAPGV